jgi:hypothetical protein
MAHRAVAGRRDQPSAFDRGGGAQARVWTRDRCDLRAPGGDGRQHASRQGGQPDVQAKLSDQGVTAGNMTPTQLGAFIRSETTKWGRIVKESGAKLD